MLLLGSYFTISFEKQNSDYCARVTTEDQTGSVVLPQPRSVLRDVTHGTIKGHTDTQALILNFGHIRV